MYIWSSAPIYWTVFTWMFLQEPPRRKRTFGQRENWQNFEGLNLWATWTDCPGCRHGCSFCVPGWVTASDWNIGRKSSTNENENGANETGA